MNAKLQASSIPAQHHAAIEACDAKLVAGGAFIDELIALFQKYGPIVLTILPQIISLVTSGGSWTTILAQIGAIIDALITPVTPPAPTPTP